MKLSELKGEREACDEEQKEEPESASGPRKRNRKVTAPDGGETKVRGHRQRDFDPSAAEEEEAESQLQESKEKESAVWTQNQQKLLELALQQFPRGTTERWDRIAKVVPGKTKVGTETLAIPDLNNLLRGSFLCVFFRRSV